MRLKVLIPSLVLLAACSAPPAAAPSGPAAGQPVGAGSPAGTASAAPAASTPAAQAGGPLVLIILSPQDEAVVNEPQIELTGSVSRDAVLTVNDEIYVLPPGDFSIPLTLEEGANALEIVASDTDGNEIALILIATYQP